MISEIPTPDDFLASGSDFLNIGWDTVSRLSLRLEEALDASWNPNTPVPDEYWKAAQRPLVTALSLVQQGVEFLLKSRIATVSPFLLISGSPREWPSGSQSVDMPFSEFKTIDAQDLIRLHDTVCKVRLPKEFITLYDKLRRQRNTIMHTVDPNLRISARDIYSSILEIADYLIGSRSWIDVRSQWLEADPDAVAYGKGDSDLPTLVQEIGHVIKLLEPAQAEKYFEFYKHRRKYLCPNCEAVCGDYFGEVPHLAQLRPNRSDSTSVYCIVCRTVTQVERQDCVYDGCRGNVIDVDEGQCLTCGGYQDQ